ncbi:MAG: diaminobutyrate acetyltransferase [Ilumatobacteraceae bacterium]|nr:diaminobutyrate acetyltransferase [Ilumatobacteraceae bacterium]
MIPVLTPLDNDPVHITVRPPTRDDAADMWRLAETSVDSNSPYSYLMLVEYLAGTCAVAVDDDGALAGFVTGFRVPDDPSTLFIWQIAVSPDRRGLGIGAQLLDGLAGRLAAPRLRYLEASVTPGNDASAALFRSFAESRRTECVEEELFDAADFPGEHDPEVRYRIGPF